MLILKFVETIKLLRHVTPRSLYSTTTIKKQHFIFQNEVKFSTTKNSNYNEKYNECIKNGLSSSTICTNEWIFNLNINDLKSGLKLLKKWNPKHMDDIFVFLQLPVMKLAYITKRTINESNTVPHGNRVYYFSTNFEKPYQEVCYHMMKYKFLFTKNFLPLHQKYQILLENKINKDDIWNDAWIFMYSIDQIKQRIACIKTSNVIIKPWMLRCKPEVFERTLRIKQDNKVILNKDSTAQYLAKRLNVPETTIRYISSKYPTTLRVSPTKLKEILDFLLKEGYNPSHILRTPRVFNHSFTTLQERLTELRDLDCQPTLTMLCKNKTTYQELVNKLILKNTKD